MILKKFAGILLALTLTLSLGTAAFAQELVAGGRAIGISMQTKGVLVDGFQAVNGKKSPAEEAGLRAGDIIIRIGAAEINSAEDFLKAVQELDGGKTSITVSRGSKARQFNITPARDENGAYKLGLRLRDGVSGIGTLTFFDPETGVYGALGHSLSNSATGAALPVQDGRVYDARIIGIERGEKGAPGYLNGRAEPSAPLGNIELNTPEGIFGKAELRGKKLETGDIKVGRASIYCTLHGQQMQEYSIEVTKIFETDEMKTVQLKVTDPALLEKTGGIVQGMSGSPIIQNGKIVGAVTHVFVNDPSSGYGISIQDMLEKGKTIDKAA